MFKNSFDEQIRESSKKRSLLGYDSVLPITYDLSQQNSLIPIKTIDLSNDFDSNDTVMKFNKKPEIFITDMSDPQKTLKI